MEKDLYFSQPMRDVRPFEFDAGVAEVFDDMVSRSVPFYHEIHAIIKDILNYRFQPGDKIFDLGCSTGTTIEIMSQHLWDQKAEFIGVDNSQPMIDKAKLKLKNIWHPFELRTTDLVDAKLENAGLVIMNYTLQFIAKEKRAGLMSKIYQSLRPGGTFIYAEKIDAPNSEVHELLTSLYYDFKKRQGYSELEIAQKREALEQVLVPYTPEEQLDLMRSVGFSNATMIFRWYNFACFLGFKNGLS